MVARALIWPARIIISRPGVPVSGSIADSDKIFDSDWNWSGLLLEAKSATDPGGGDWNVLFNHDYGYRPCVVARMLAASSVSVPWSGPSVQSPSQQMGAGQAVPIIYSDRIVFPRDRTTGGSMNYGTIEYEVYGVD
ncbi:hypothetical protein PH552_12380 [Rhizobium sp. CNPSo 3968]|uniref:hypothetical protein n=1 Tax=Rhizobium sp. CNPSo 3968 TaxID=3021408 RepID=UPI00254D5F96|nr:hypothetical protein [Rhizobium sp. CNPSo 3968]MDK4720141.1 hypothetical protein [Rhizobium sp. CNPSo 3968]